MGQMKLLISEIDFLSDFARHCDNVVYAGASDGRHIPTLDAMFRPLNISWSLFDPCRFDACVMDWSRKNSNRISLFRRCFVDQDAVYYNGFKRVLFISDIRTGGQQQHTRTRDGNHRVAPGDENVMEDQTMQMRWVHLMHPTACCLKFRGTFTYEDCQEQSSFDYIHGQLRLQAWPPPNSSEVRLVASAPYTTATYDSRHLDEATSYYNEHDRLLCGNDARIQDFVLNKYENNHIISEECRQRGLLHFRDFESSYKKAENCS
jgi:hypothetical protein